MVIVKRSYASKVLRRRRKEEKKKGSLSLLRGSLYLVLLEFIERKKKVYFDSKGTRKVLKELKLI